MGEEEKLYEILVRKLGGKGQLGRSKRRWEDGIRIYHGDNGWEGVEWIQLAQDRDRCRPVLDAVMNLRVLAPRS
jgi:hypothetical protein